MRSQREAMRHISPEDLKAMDARDLEAQKASDAAAKKRRQSRKESSEFSDTELEARGFGLEKNLPGRSQSGEIYTTKDFSRIENLRKEKATEVENRAAQAFAVMSMDQKLALGKEKSWLKHVILDAVETRPKWPVWDILKHLVEPVIEKRIIEESLQANGERRKTKEEADRLSALEILTHFIHNTVPEDTKNDDQLPEIEPLSSFLPKKPTKPSPQDIPIVRGIEDDYEPPSEENKEQAA